MKKQELEKIIKESIGEVCREHKVNLREDWRDNHEKNLEEKKFLLQIVRKLKSVIDEFKKYQLSATSSALSEEGMRSQIAKLEDYWLFWKNHLSKK